MKKRILYILLGVLFFGNIYGQESFNLNTSTSTPSNDGNYCGRVIFTVVNNNNFPIEIELWQKIPGASTFTSPGTTTTINPNGTIGINSSFATTAGSYSYYAVFTKQSDNSFLSNTSLSPINVIVYPRPVAGNITGTNEVCVGLTIPLASNPSGGSLPYSYAWTSSTESKGTVVNTGVVTGVEGGTTNISYIVTDSKGCISPSSAANTVTVKALPSVTFIEAADFNECQNSEVTYTTQPGKTDYQWTSPSILNTDYVITNGGLGLTNNTVSLKWITTGSKTMQVNYTDANFCTAASSTNTTATVNALPATPTVTNPTICEGQTATITTPVGTYTYTWTVPTGVAAPGNVNSFTTTKVGTYSLTITNSNTCTSDVGVGAVIVNTKPATPTVTSPIICEGQTATITTPSGVYTYTWTVPTGVAAPGNVNSFTTTKAGTYSLTITNSNTCTSDVGVGAVLVNTKPATPTVTSPTICEGQTATITTPSGVYTYTWTVPSGVTAPGNVNTFATTKAGTYSVTITNSNSCTSDIGRGTVVVNPLPAKPTLTSPIICEGVTASVTMLTPTGTSTYTYTWTVPSGVATSTIKTVSTTKAGTYSLTISDANSCMSEVGTGTVVVYALPPKPTLTSPKICEGETASVTMLTPTGTSTYTYTWTVPTGVATSTTKTVSTTKAGTYSLTISDANSCTSEVGTGTVTVNPIPAKPTLTSPIICEGVTASVTMLTPSGTNTYTYTWTVPTGVATSTTNTVSTTKAGTYSLTITDVNSCTSEVGTGTVTVNPIPAKPTLTSPIICEGMTASVTMLTPSGTSTYTYTWTVPTGVATSTTNTVSTTKAGTYSLTITDDNSCTSEVGTGTVLVNALPTVTITNPSAVCAPGTVDLTASTITAGSTASLTYSYFTNATATSTLTNTTLIGSSGTYYIKGTTASNCSAVNPVIISINPVPTFNVTSPSVCIGSPLKVTANPLTGVITDYDYTWVVPTGVTNPGNVSNFTTTIAGVYAATIKYKTTNCASAPVNNSVSFYPLPTAAAIVATDNKVVVDKTLNLTAAASGGSSPYSISWTPNPTIYYTISGQENAVFTALKEGKVKFKYQVKDANSCEVSSVEYEITIDPADIILVLPNAFTPNGDGNNDIFKIAASNLLGQNAFKSLEIYNRNGKLMFRTEDITQGWNGRSDNVLQDMGVYFVKLVKLNKDGQLVVETSPIYLLK